MKKKLNQLERHITHLKYRMSIISSKSLNNLLQMDEQEIEKELKQLKKEVDDAERLYIALKFEFTCIKYTMIGVVGMMFYVLLMTVIF